MTRATEALRWAVSLVRDGGLGWAVRSWRERCRNHGIVCITAELVQGTEVRSSSSSASRSSRQLMRWCEEMGSEVESVSGGVWLPEKEMLQELRQEMQLQEHEREKKERHR